MKRLLMGAVGAAVLVMVGTALGARGYSDTPGDDNAAPDITAVEISEATPGILTINVTFANYETLPANSWVNFWFDVDSNASTGDGGDETLFRYTSDGAIELFTWNGSRLVESPTDGIMWSTMPSALSVSLPRASINAAGAFGLLAVSSRGQGEGSEELIASDFAPDRGRSAYTGTAPLAFPDPANDHDAAPDITDVRVSDAKDGWITFAISTPNYTSLPPEAVVVVIVDVDGNPRTGSAGAELTIGVGGGEIALERWNARSKEWVPDDLPTRARVRSGGGVVTIEVHVSELDSTRRFGFAVGSLDVNPATGDVLGLDLAPDNFSFWHYALVYKPVVTLVVTKLFSKPSRPHAGKPFTVGLAATRSDTHRPVASGTVGCHVVAVVNGKKTKVSAKGFIVGGAGRCMFVVPQGAQGRTLRGTITVRSGGTSVARDFTYLVL